MLFVFSLLFFSRKEKKQKKSDTKKRKTARQAQTGPKPRVPFATGKRMLLSFREKKKKQKKSDTGKRKSRASRTKRSQTTTAFCDKRYRFIPTAKRAHRLRARFVTKASHCLLHARFSSFGSFFFPKRRKERSKNKKEARFHVLLFLLLSYLKYLTPDSKILSWSLVASGRFFCKRSPTRSE